MTEGKAAVYESFTSGPLMPADGKSVPPGAGPRE